MAKKMPWERPKRERKGYFILWGARAVAARRVRRRAYALGHLLTKFKPSKDNSYENKLGDTFYAECCFCHQAVCINFSPFDESEEHLAEKAVSKKHYGAHLEVCEAQFVSAGLPLKERCKETMSDRERAEHD